MGGTDLMGETLKRDLEVIDKERCFLLAWKKANIHVVNCPWGHVARNPGWPLGEENGPHLTTSKKIGTSPTTTSN